MKSPIARVVVWVCGLLICVAAMVVSTQLALLHTRPPEPGGVVSLLCTSMRGSSCEKVARSRWSMFPPLPLEIDRAEAASKPGDEAEKDEEKDLTPAEVKKIRETHVGISTAQLGLIFFGVALCWLFFIGPRPVTRGRWYTAFLVATLLGLVGSAFFEDIMWTQLEAWCPLCVIAHACSLLLVGVVVLLRTPREAAGDLIVETSAPVTPAAVGSGLFDSPAPVVPRRVVHEQEARWPTNPVLLAVVVSALLLTALEHFWLRNEFHRKAEEVANATRDYYKRKFDLYDRHWQHNLISWQLMPVVNIPVKDRPVRGPANAAHTIVIFSDFECPGCAQVEQYLRRTVMPIGAKGSGFKVIFKHWPICKDCNDVMEGNTLHPAACQAAQAAEAARIVGGNDAFWKMHDLLFGNQDRWKKSRDFVSLAKEIGLDEAAFRKAMASSQALDRVLEDIHDGVALGDQVKDLVERAEIKVTGTPSVFVDGKRLTTLGRARTWAAIAGANLNSLKPATRPAAPPALGPRVGQ